MVRDPVFHFHEELSLALYIFFIRLEHTQPKILLYRHLRQFSVSDNDIDQIYLHARDTNQYRDFWG